MAPPGNQDKTAPSTLPEAEEEEEAEEEILSPAARAERDNPRPPPPAAPPTPPLRSHVRSNTQPFLPTERPQMYSEHPRPATYSAPNYYGPPPPPPVIIVTQPTFMENMVATPPALHSPHGFGRPHHHHHYHEHPPEVHPIQIEEPPPSPPTTRHTDVLLHLTLCTCVAGHKREDLGCFARECIGTADLTAGPFKCDVAAGGLLGLLGAVVTWPFICCLGTMWGSCKFCCVGMRRRRPQYE